MYISPETKKVSEIFSIDGEQRYFIPNYQRQYSWKNEQIETLIDDMSKEETGYYIGNLLINQKDAKEKLEVVDGQQRLTTISLIFIGIHDILNDPSIFFFSDGSPESELKIQNSAAVIKADIVRKIVFNQDCKHPKYELLIKDHSYYIDVIDSSFNKKSIRNKNKVFVKRYMFIVETIRENFKTFDDLESFYRKVNSTELLKITVSKLSDAYSIFSSLNSKGLPLTLVDLLKNEYLKVSNKEKIDEEVASKKWEQLVELFLIDDEIQVSDITQFLLNNYDALESKESSSITKAKALDKYSSIMNKGSSYIDILISRAAMFNYIKNGNGLSFNQTLDEEIKKLSYLDHSQSFPLLLYIFTLQKDLKLTDIHLSDIIDYTIKFYVRRNVTLRPKSSNARAQFMNMNRVIKKEKLVGEDIVKLIYKQLTSISDSDDIFKEQLVSDGIYDKSKDTTRFILIELERKYGNYFNKSNPDTLEDYIQTNKTKKSKLRWTIEHILPQGDNLPEHWKSSLSKNNPEDAKIIQEEFVHKIGNLTLTPYNAEMGQKSFLEKKSQSDNGKYVGLKIDLFLNRSIIDSDEDWENKEYWDAEDINRRSQVLAESIIELFRF